MISITIDECTEGYLVWNLDENGLKSKKEVYAVSKDKLVQKTKELLGISDKSRPAMTSDVKLERPAVKTEPQSKIETDVSPGAFVLKECIFPYKETECQAFNSGKMHWLVSKTNEVRIRRDGYDLNIFFKIEDLKYLYDHLKEATDIIRTFGKSTIVNKATVLRMFMREVSFEKIIYPVQSEKIEPKGQEDGCCDDIAFESCANNKPENCKFCIDQSRYEDKKKIAAQKPGAPLLKASMGV